MADLSNAARFALGQIQRDPDLSDVPGCIYSAGSWYRGPWEAQSDLDELVSAGLVRFEAGRYRLTEQGKALSP